MTLSDPGRKPVVARPRGGLLHALDAARYSLAGFRRLLHETAARLELLAGAVVALAYLWVGATIWQWLVSGFLLALILAVEALNTAIELLCDHVSPDWSQMAKEAKDLGSLAVGLLLLIAGCFVVSVLSGII